MVITLPGTPTAYSNPMTSASATGTVGVNCGSSGQAFLLSAIITFNASAAGKIWFWSGTTATVIAGPFYPVTCDSWVLNFGPVGFPAYASGADIGWCCSTSGLTSVQMMGYTK